MKVVRIIFFCLIVFMALPEFMIGVPSLIAGIRSHSSDVWSIRHDYFAEAAFTLIAGFLAVFLAGWCAFRAKKHNWIYSLFATGIVFFMAVQIPDFYMDPAGRVRSTTASKMQYVQAVMDKWGNDKGNYPRDAAEVALALKDTNLGAAEPLGPSRYQRGDHAFDYEVVTTTNASGPKLGGTRPGLLNYSVDASATHYWLTGTTLPAPVSNSVIALQETNGGPPLIILGELTPPPAPTPTPKKK